jgi:hypothetical protein
VLFELGETNRLGQVKAETGRAAFGEVVFHAIAAQGDARQRESLAELAHQFVAGQVRQAEVADDEI